MKSIYNQKSIFLLFKIYIKMDSTKIIEIIAYTLPSLITGGVAYFLLIPILRISKTRDDGCYKKKISPLFCHFDYKRMNA